MKPLKMEDGGIKYIYKGRLNMNKKWQSNKRNHGKDTAYFQEKYLKRSFLKKNYEYFKDGMLKVEYDNEGRRIQNASI